MSGRDYLERLGAALSGLVPDRERLNALRYYKEYFESAGPEREQEIIRELGSPEGLAERIAREGGYLEEDGKKDAPRKRRKWPVLVAGTLAVAVLVSISAASVGRRIGNWVRSAMSDGGTYEAVAESQRTPDVSQGFTELKVDIALGNVSVREGDGYSLWIECSPGFAGYHIESELKGGELVVSSSGNGSGKNWGESANAKVVVEVPRGCALAEADIKAGLGNVVLDRLSAKEMKAKTGMGNVTADDLGQVVELSLETGMGDVVLTGAMARETELKAGTGSVTVEAACKAEECDYKLETGIGAVTVDGSSMGQQAKKSVGSAYSLEAEVGLGGIEVDFQ